MAQVSFYSPTHGLLASQLAPPRNSRLSVVDYGCGEGELLKYLPLEKIKTYCGFEVNKACLPVANKNWQAYRNFQFKYIDRNHLPSLGKAQSVDVLFLVGVVQYLPEADLQHVLKEAARVLKPGGQLLISCTTDHALYKWLNVYRLFLPHYSVNRQILTKQILKSSLKVKSQFERGLVLTPFFANIFVFFFDALDKVVFRTKGELGPIGRKVRALWAPIIKQEFQLPIDFGYTLFIVASKEAEAHNRRRHA